MILGGPDALTFGPILAVVAEGAIVLPPALASELRGLGLVVPVPVGRWGLSVAGREWWGGRPDWSRANMATAGREMLRAAAEGRRPDMVAAFDELAPGLHLRLVAA